MFDSPQSLLFEAEKEKNRSENAHRKTMDNGQWNRQCFFDIFFYCRYMIESPRWLTTRGRLDEAADVLNRIGEINGKSINITEKLLRSALPSQKAEKVYGMLSLFSGLRLAKNTLILIICW